MRNPWLFRFAILLALSALAIVVDGAVIATYSLEGTPNTAFAGTSIHSIASSAVAVFALAAGIWLGVKDPRPLARRLGWTIVAVVAAAGALGLPQVLRLLPRLAGVLHATLAQVFFAATAAMALVTSPVWERGPEFVSDYGWPSNRSLAIATPVIVLIQIFLGAAFRQKAATLLPHVLGAMLVAIVILMQGVFVLQQFPAHRALRAAAKTLLGVGFAQVFLGISALTVRTMTDEISLPVVITIASHVTGGALTLAATVVLSILIRRNVQPRVEEPAA